MVTAFLCLATAVYFEARSEPYDGQVAVAEVILNRVHDTHFPDTICGVVKQKHQFSFYSDGKSDIPQNTLAFARAKQAAADALLGRGLGLTATYYHATYVTPYWAKKFTREGQIGHHIFYTNQGTSS